MFAGITVVISSPEPQTRTGHRTDNEPLTVPKPAERLADAPNNWRSIMDFSFRRVLHRRYFPKLDKQKRNRTDDAKQPKLPVINKQCRPFKIDTAQPYFGVEQTIRLFFIQTLTHCQYSP